MHASWMLMLRIVFSGEELAMFILEFSEVET
jgi:hypothetical protein